MGMGQGFFFGRRYIMGQGFNEESKPNSAEELLSITSTALIEIILLSSIKFDYLYFTTTTL